MIFSGSVALFAVLLALFFFKWLPYPRPKGIRLEKIDLDSINARLNPETRFLIEAIQKSIDIIKKRAPDIMTIFGKKVPKEDYIKALIVFKGLLSRGIPEREALKRCFIPYEIKSGQQNKRLLLTGYYQPEFSGSLERTEVFSVPVFSWPEDLIRVRLKDFSENLPGISLWGRILGKRLIPYYTRSQIESRSSTYPVLCWLRDEVELLELQIQGSGIIDLKGQKRFIHYAASNGRKYKSIGKILIKKGLIKGHGVTWDDIREFAQKNPEKFKNILYQNERYVFFKWEDKGPIGSYGKVIVSGASLALDSKFYPPGIPVLIIFRLPDVKTPLEWLNDPGNGVIALIGFNHDTGSAIKGPFRADIFVGTGERALSLAGRLKNHGRIIILLPIDRRQPRN